MKKSTIINDRLFIVILIILIVASSACISYSYINIRKEIVDTCSYACKKTKISHSPDNIFHVVWYDEAPITSDDINCHSNCIKKFGLISKIIINTQ